MTEERTYPPLLPCPFCGGSPSWCDCGGDCHQMQCVTCGWQIDNASPEAHNAETLDVCREVMARRWNTRALSTEHGQPPAVVPAPVAWLLRTGHGDKVALTKPACAVDRWQPLYASPPVAHDGGLRRALLALADELSGDAALIAKMCGRKLHKVLRDFDPRASTLAAPSPPSVDTGSSGERCESGDPACGPVEFHDSEGVPLCAACWNSLDPLDEKPKLTLIVTECPHCVAGIAPMSSQLCRYCHPILRG